MAKNIYNLYAIQVTFHRFNMPFSGALDKCLTISKYSVNWVGWMNNFFFALLLIGGNTNCRYRNAMKLMHHVIHNMKLMCKHLPCNIIRYLLILI